MKHMICMFSLHVNKQTWEMHLNSMVDTTGQKIGLGRIDKKEEKY